MKYPDTRTCLACGHDSVTDVGEGYWLCSRRYLSPHDDEQMYLVVDHLQTLGWKPETRVPREMLQHAVGLALQARPTVSSGGVISSADAQS